MINNMYLAMQSIWSNIYTFCSSITVPGLLLNFFEFFIGLFLLTVLISVANRIFGIGYNSYLRSIYKTDNGKGRTKK